MFDRLSSFFNSRRKKSRGSQHSDSSPASPLSPHLSQSLQEVGTHTPTPPRQDGRDPLSHSSSIGSLLRDGGDLPFADSNSSGRSSVRELHVCCERTSGSVTPTPQDLPAGGFTQSVLEEVNRSLQVHLDMSGDHAVCPPTCKIPFPLTAEVPKSPNLTSISLSSKKTTVTVGGRGFSTELRGITLGSQHGREHPSPVPSAEPRGASPVQLHKAVWVETYLGEEEEDGGREGGSGGEEGSRAGSPPVLAIPVRVIPDDESVSQGAGDSPSAPTETPPHHRDLQQLSVSSPPTAAESQTSEEGSAQREVRVTRRTVNLPSKNTASAQKVCAPPQPRVDGNKVQGGGYSPDWSTEASGPAGAQR